MNFFLSRQSTKFQVSDTMATHKFKVSDTMVTHKFLVSSWSTPLVFHQSHISTVIFQDRKTPLCLTKKFFLEPTHTHMRYTKPKTCPYTVCLFNAALMEHGLHTPRPSMDIVKCTTTNLGTKGIKLPKPRALMGDNHYGLCNVITWGKSTCCV